MIKLDFSTWQKEHSENPHVVFNGDNIEVLKKLHKIYDKQVSCIYIDPPYNNGEQYTYYSDVQTHDKWLKQMERVLRELKEFLKEDGSFNNDLVNDIYNQLEFKYFPIHWKLFYGFAKHGFATGVYLLLLCIKKIIGK